ncbi:MAG: GNAT family N-acetyltransferase [Acidimicrobiia bacterium]
MTTSNQRFLPELKIDQLFPNEGRRLREIRLRALRADPHAFETTFEQASAWHSERWSQQLEALVTFVATLDNADVGMVRGARNEQLRDAGHLISMWVARESRRQGIGSALVDSVILWARNEGLTQLFLDVREGNKAALALYASRRFAPTGEVKVMPPPREDVREIEMSLNL